MLYGMCMVFCLFCELIVCKRYISVLVCSLIEGSFLFDSYSVMRRLCMCFVSLLFYFTIMNVVCVFQVIV